MTLGAALIPNSENENILKGIRSISAQMGKEFLHCKDLNHAQKVFLARSAARFKMRLFGVVSRKATLGTYKDDIADDSKMYYNKCAQYLLERVGMFMEARGIYKADLDIVFEKANCDYDSMKNLLRKCQRSPKHENTAKLRYIDVDNILIKPKEDEAFLQIADLVAHALYKCVDKTPQNYNIPEPRYLQELQSRFFGNPSDNKVINFGIYCVHSTNNLGLDVDIKSMLDQLKSQPPQIYR